MLRAWVSLSINLYAASNRNNVLTDFSDSGRYVCKREFFKTISPSMDILISSNLERLLYEFLDRNSNQTTELMNSLSEMGAYSITDKTHESIRSTFLQITAMSP